MSASKRCIVVADGTFARILLADPHAATPELIEHSEVENCSSAHDVKSIDDRLNGGSGMEAAATSAAPRVGKRVNVDQEFAVAVAHHVGVIVQDWRAGDVVIAAEPGTLGMLREIVQQALPKGVQLKALAKNYLSLSAPELAQRLDVQ
jgi:protein required for attachment to host cells